MFYNVPAPKAEDPKHFVRMVSSQLAAQFTDAQLAELSPTFREMMSRAKRAGTPAARAALAFYP